MTEQALGCLLPGFEGLEVPEWVRRRLADGLGGVVLYARNVESREQLARLTTSLRAERPDVLIAIDEEGGDVTRLEASTGSSYPGNAALGAVDDVELTEQVAASLGADLAGVGVNLDFAPVADVDSNPENPIIGIRSFGADPSVVSRHVAAFVRGLQSAGVAACAKHFPGHGDTRADSHLELPVVEADLETLRERELPPFRAAIEAGVRALMTAHIAVPAVDAAPATLSRVFLTELLRDELGFEGLVVTDALEMRAVSATVGVEEGAVRAVAAGADALCFGHDLGDAAVDGVASALVESVRSGRLDEERLVEAARRVREAASAALPAAAPSPQADSGQRAARRALEVVGSPALSRRALVVDLVTPPSIAVGKGLGAGERLHALLPGAELLLLHEEERVPDRGAEQQLVVVTRDARRHAWQRRIVGELVEREPDAVIVEVGLPRWRPNGDGAFIATYGAGRVNLEAAAEALRG